MLPPNEWPTLESSREYTVGWIAALPHERAAATMMLDQRHNMPKGFRKITGDPNEYSWGSIGGHNIAIASLPSGEYGLVSAADTASGMTVSLPQIRVGLLVGIGAGISGNKNILLGDVVVSNPDGTNGGVVQYDLYKSRRDGIERKGFLNGPPRSLRAALSNLKAEHEMHCSSIPRYMEIFRENEKMKTGYIYPGSDQDPVRAADQTLHLRDSPEIHYGTIASGNVLIKDAEARDDILARLKAENVDPICFEMEAAGLMNNFPCLVIRGICDYADERKNDVWQRYAAGTAAAFAKEFLGYLTPAAVEETPAICDVLDKVAGVVQETNQTTARLETKFSDRQLYRWLSPRDNSVNYNEALQKRHPGTGFWFLDSSSFQKWKTTPGSSLWLYGESGRGKTILSTSIIENLRRNSNSEGSGDSTLLYFYFDFNNASGSTLDAMARSLIWQATTQLESAGKHIRSLFAEHNDGNKAPMTSVLLKALQYILEMGTVTRIVVDALDECSTREGLIAWLGDITAKKLDQVHLITTSRPDLQFKRFFQKLTKPHRRMQLDADVIDGDIRAYIEARVQTPGFKRWNGHSAIQEEILSELTMKSKGMFRLAACQLDELEHCLDYPSLKATLSSLPSNLNDMYSRMLTKIEKRNKAKAIRVLQFLTYADVNLRLDQIVDVVAISLGPEQGFDKKNRMPNAREVALICPGLIATVAGELHSFERYLQLSHASVKDYLVHGEIESGFRDCLQESAARSAIAQVSLIYFLSVDPIHALIFNPRTHRGKETKAVRDAKSAKAEADRAFPLMRLSARLWMPNYSQTQAKDDQLYTLAMRVFAHGCYFSYWLQLCCLDYSDSMWTGARSFYQRYYGLSMRHSTPLYCASLGGLTDCVKTLLQNNYTDCHDFQGDLYSALLAAVSQGHTQTVELLIANGAINSESSNGMALAIGGDSQTVELPTLNTIDALKADTSLAVAAGKGHLHILKLLIANGACVNKTSPSRHGSYSALAEAAEKGHRVIVDWMLSRGADTNVQGRLNGEPLTRAAVGGHQQIVELLISKGARTNFATPLTMHQSGEQTPSKDIKTREWLCSNRDPCNPLTGASSNGHHQIVEFLISQGADMSVCKNSLNCALISASAFGHLHIVRSLISSGLCMGSQDPSNDVALLEAARECHVQVSSELLSNGANPNAQDATGRTALLLVLSNSRKADTDRVSMVELLVSYNADINVQNAEGDTALSLAIYQGSDKIVEILVSKHAEMHWDSSVWQAALFRAISKGYDNTVSMILPNGVPTNMRDSEGNSLLHLAVTNGRCQIAAMLVSNDAEMNKQYAWGTTLLHLATLNNNSQVVKKLISRGAKLDLKDRSGETALLMAAKYHHDEIGEMLILKGAQVNVRNVQGRTALDLAADRDNDDASNMLSSALVDVMISNGADVEYALQVVAKFGRKEAIETLISKGALGLDTALEMAAREGHEKIVELLILHGATAYDAAFEAAAFGTTQRHRRIVGFLFSKGARALDAALIAANITRASRTVSFDGNKACLQIITFLMWAKSRTSQGESV